jgi:hypothetical protein
LQRFAFAVLALVAADALHAFTSSTGATAVVAAAAAAIRTPNQEDFSPTRQKRAYTG